MTITLAIGVQNMARRNAIIRRLPAVETLGSATARSRTLRVAAGFLTHPEVLAEVTG